MLRGRSMSRRFGGKEGTTPVFGGLGDVGAKEVRGRKLALRSRLKWRKMKAQLR